MANETPMTPLEPEQVVEALKALRQQIPDYVQLHLSSEKALRPVANVQDEFLESAISAANESALVRTAIGMTPDEMRQDLSVAKRWDAVENELRALLQGVSAANLVRRHKVGLAGLQVYSISRQLVRKEGEHSDLLPHVKDMQRLNRFGRKRQPATEPVPASEPKQKT